MTEDVGHDGGDTQLWQLVNVDTDLGRVFDSAP